MESIRIPYKNDDYGNPVFAKVVWSKVNKATSRPVALVYHGGGYIIGSSEIIPKSQVDYLAREGFIIVIPNYRLVPQVAARDVFADCEQAFDWAVKALPETMKSAHDIELDTSKVVAMGHSAGGTIAIHMASQRPVKAVTAFYPSLFTSDPSTSAHRPTTAPPFGQMPDYEPSDDDWASISPSGTQLSEAPLAMPGTVVQPRNKWQMHIMKHGQWLSTVAPDGDFAVLDPFTTLSPRWAPVMIVQGDADKVPGCGLELAQRAEREMKAAGVGEVRLEVVVGESHMFDLPPTVGTTDVGPKWQAVVKGLDWLKDHVV